MAYYPSPEKCSKIRKNQETESTEQITPEPKKLNYFVWFLVIALLLYIIK